MEDTALMNAVINEVGKWVVGQNYMIERLLIGVLMGGHVLLEGVSGLVKTRTVRTTDEAEAEDVTSDTIVTRILDVVPTP